MTQEIYKKYAEHLKNNHGFCVDLTSTTTTPMLYQPASNLKINSNAIVYNWPAFKASQNIKIEKEDYHQFKRDLVSGVMSYLPLISGTGFCAGSGAFFTLRSALLANKYVPYKPDISAVMINPVLFEYFERLFENAQDEKMILDFCADIIQNPARKPQWGLVITGDQGCGKSRLPELVKLALGGYHCFIEDEYGKALDKFSETFVDNLLVAFDDPARDNAAAYEKLKLSFVQSEMEIENKGLQTRFIRKSQSRIMLLHNSERPWVFPASDRRLYVSQRMTHKSKHNLDGCELNSAAFFEKFIEWQESANAPLEIYKFFSERDLGNFRHGSTVKTEQHKKMAQLGISVTDTLITAFFEDHGASYRFHENELTEYLKENGVSHPNADSLKLKLSALNYERKRREVGEDRLWIWQPILSQKSPSFLDAEKQRIRHHSKPTF